MIIQIVSLVYNFLLISLAAWWLLNLKRHDKLNTFEAIATIFVIILHGVIILKILNPLILAQIKFATAKILNIVTLSYWIGIFLPQLRLWQKTRKQRLILQLFFQG